jgi:hypothetical protein
MEVSVRGLVAAVKGALLGFVIALVGWIAWSVPGWRAWKTGSTSEFVGSVAYHLGEAAADAANFLDAFLALNPWIIACIAFFTAATVWFEQRARAKNP